MGKNGHKKNEAINMFGLDMVPWIVKASEQAKKQSNKGQGPAMAKIIVLGEQKSPEQHLGDLGIALTDWVKDRLTNRRNEPLLMTAEHGPTWYVFADTSTDGQKIKDLGQFLPTSFGRFRDVVGAAATGVLDYQLPVLMLEFIGCTNDEKAGALVGLEIGLYRFRNQRGTNGKAPTQLLVHGASDEEIAASGRLGLSVNLARHLVNLPPAELNPSSFASAAKELLGSAKNTEVHIIKGEALEKEGAGLLRAVGRAGEEGPALVHISYRPEKSEKTSKQRPVAFVGKGITFDSGGLDMKDAAGMRLMKKDMGGAGSVLGLAWWVTESQIDRPCDFYLALAENAVDKKSFHPGDIIKARSGLSVEIDNTDAEGRLVLADAIDYAVDRKDDKDKPEVLINLATLTGAMRVALGTRISGMFCNDDTLAGQLLQAAKVQGEPAWRMPLYDDYFVQMKSTVADFMNSGGRFGGAITAALFLQKFVKDVAWAHFDVYCWTEPGTGGCQELGGNGQCIQTLSRFLIS